MKNELIYSNNEFIYKEDSIRFYEFYGKLIIQMTLN